MVMFDRRSEPRAGRVLVVDDDIEILKALRDVLEDEGYEVMDATDGAEALPLLKSSPPPDVMLLDLMMPEMDGWTLLQHMRNDADVAKIPVVIMTAAGRTTREAIGSSANLLTKPLDLGVLLRALQDARSRRTS